MKHVIRIIGGQFRGKKLHFPSQEGLRPTPDRVRETIFNWLMHVIRNARCLDAFAGSGALGFEAYSRGAAKVVLIEKAPNVFANLEKVASSFDASNLTTIKQDAIDYLKHAKEQFDIVFLDPPFASDYLPQCIKILAESTLLVSGGLLYVEAAEEIPMDTTHWQPIKLKRTGQVVYALYEKR